MLTSQDGRFELILEVEKYGSCLNALKALVDRRREVHVRLSLLSGGQEGFQCEPGFTNDCFSSPFNRTDWRRQPTKCTEHMTACVRSHCNSSPKAAAPLAGGVTVCGRATETLRPCNSVPFATCIKDGRGRGAINPLQALAESRLFPHSRPSRTTSLRR